MRKKIVSPAMCEVYNGKTARAFAKIEFSDDGRLSICGVIGPMGNGDCKGSAGQCVDSIREGKPCDGWDEEMLARFCASGMSGTSMICTRNVSTRGCSVGGNRPMKSSTSTIGGLMIES